MNKFVFVFLILLFMGCDSAYLSIPENNKNDYSVVEGGISELNTWALSNKDKKIDYFCTFASSNCFLIKHKPKLNNQENKFEIKVSYKFIEIKCPAFNSAIAEIEKINQKAGSNCL